MSVFDTVDIDHRLVMIVCCVVDQGSFSLGFLLDMWMALATVNQAKMFLSKSLIIYIFDILHVFLLPISTNKY